jgi:hypothetical protein
MSQIFSRRHRIARTIPSRAPKRIEKDKRLVEAAEQACLCVKAGLLGQDRSRVEGRVRVRSSLPFRHDRYRLNIYNRVICNVCA